MTIPNVRSNPSGALVAPLPAKGIFVWDGLQPLSLVLQPTGHPPGLYRLVMTQMIRVASSAGTQTQTVFWNQPRVGASSVAVGIGNPTSAVYQGLAYRIVESDGTAPITITYALAGLVGAFSAELACFAQLDALPPS